MSFPARSSRTNVILPPSRSLMAGGGMKSNGTGQRDSFRPRLALIAS